MEHKCGVTNALSLFQLIAMVSLKLFQSVKYDIAISVAEEDLNVAEKIGNALRERNVTYYLYTKDGDRNWGKHIFETSIEVYGNSSRYVLLITSRIYKEKYWANIERMISMQYPGKQRPEILQLKIDETEIDGIEKYIIYKKWEDNASEIADIIKRKLIKDWWQRFKKRVAGCFLVLLFFTVPGFWIYMQNRSYPERKNGDSETTLKTLPDPVQLRKRILIPKTTFLMGYNDSSNNAAPPHYVTLSPFRISATEVTVAQYEAYCKNKNIPMPPQPYGPDCDSYPVVNVSWYDAMAYCKWKDGGRLPTEAEWEYAAGAGLGHRYSGGNNAASLAVYDRATPYKVGSRLPNGFGLYDMSGNVAEWCLDWFDSTYFSASTGKFTNPRGPASGREKVLRGGAYNSTINPVNTLHISFRSKEIPDRSKIYVGFRVVWDH